MASGIALIEYGLTQIDSFRNETLNIVYFIVILFFFYYKLFKRNIFFFTFIQVEYHFPAIIIIEVKWQSCLYWKYRQLSLFAGLVSTSWILCLNLKLADLPLIIRPLHFVDFSVSSLLTQLWILASIMK